MIMKQKIYVPKGCKVVSVETTDEMVVVKFEKEDPEFKENDIVTCETEGIKWIAIFKDKIDAFSFRAKALYTTVISQSDWCSYGEKCSIATESEKQLLFDKLKENCLMFDGENIVRWRANVRCDFYYLSGNSMVMNDVECGHNWQNSAYESGNYFPTREMAESFQKQYLELLNNFHKNL